MKISVLMGSPRHHANTAALCKPFIETLRTLGAQVHYQCVSDLSIAPCKGCYACQDVSEEYGCVQQDDMQSIVDIIRESDVLVLATPIYSWFCPAEMKALLDRLYGMNKFYGKGNGSLWADKGIALLTTHGYDRSFGAGPFETGMQRECQHSHLHYMGMYSVRDEDNLASFQTEAAVSGAKTFAKEIFETAQQRFLKKILQNWNITPENLTSIYSSAWNIDDSYVLKHRENVKEIEKSIALTARLRQAGIPVVKYLPTIDKRSFLTDEDGYWCLMERLPGGHFKPFEVEGLSFFHELGRLIARLHMAFQEIEADFPGKDHDCAEEFSNYILPEIQENRLPLSPEILAFLETELINLYPKLPRQLIHRDMHPGNLLFHEGVLNGYIDFDLSQRNTRIFDICYFCLSMLLGQLDNTQNCNRWFSMCQTLLRGYQTLLPLSETETASIPMMMLFIEALFVAFWSKMGNSPEVLQASRLAAWLYDNRAHLTFYDHGERSNVLV